ncbi:MAG: ribonuclease III, ribonuclease III [Microgenomates group bacterium GW2011_GWC1_49_7]|nr:MAG: ribonuclease III, ribonuclease III [Microgenomates group bacterium GW2011_GWC1_49_7]
MTFEDLQKTIGIQFTNQDLLKQAFIHRSYLNEAKHLKTSNERLEFLGDAVLSFLTSEFLYTSYPQYPEGILTNVRSSLVKTKSLSDIAAQLHLGELLFLSHGEEASGGRTNQSLLADVCEALLGAVFLDQGIETARRFLSTYLFPKTKDIIEKKAYIDFKSLLQELIQQDSRLSPTYEVIKSEGPDHARMFWVEAHAGGRILGSGQGKSKQEAEQAAALSALEKMGKI